MSDFVFLVGSPRSGTTLLQKVLANHPNISTGHETNLFDSYLSLIRRSWFRDVDPTSSGRGPIGLSAYMTQEEFDSFYKQVSDLLLNSITRHSQARFFLEKTPSHALFVDDINVTLPTSKFIFLFRDPIGSVLSILNASRSWGRNWAPSNVFKAMNMWKFHSYSMLEAIESLEASRFYVLSYESLLAHPLHHILNIYQFLDLSVDEALMDQCSSTMSDRSNQTNIPIYGEARAVLNSPLLIEPNDFSKSTSHQFSFGHRVIIRLYCGPLYRNIKKLINSVSP